MIGMTLSRKALIAIGIIVVLLFLWYATSVQGQATERGTLTEEPRGSDWERGKLRKWNVRIVSYDRRQPAPRHPVYGASSCDNHAVGRAKAVGGNWFIDEVISFYSRIDWCWGAHNGEGGQVWDVNLSISPEHSRYFWQFNGIVASGSGQLSQGHRLCGPMPQPECMFRERTLEYYRGLGSDLSEKTHPRIRWVITGGGGCTVIKEVSGETQEDRC